MKSNGRHNIEKLQHLFWRHTSSEARYRSPASLRIEKKVCSKPPQISKPIAKNDPVNQNYGSSFFSFFTISFFGAAPSR